MVDLVQVFTGDAAVRAALEDGVDRSAAEVRDTYVRNQNDRLRTLEMLRVLEQPETIKQAIGIAN